MFPLVRVDRRSAIAIEPLGTKNKFWFTSPNGQRALFKAEERGTGEDWAEKIACELAALIGLPHVHYELAFEAEARVPGVVCERFLAPSQALAHGNQLLVQVEPSYPMDHRRFKVAAHTTQAVATLAHTLRPPPAPWISGVPAFVTTALDVFAGYLMFDAWIANQDRHHENWGAVRDANTLSLAPSYDHGAAMARNITDEERHERMTTKDANRHIGRFARRARSALYADTAAARPLTTVAAWRAFADFAPGAATAWLDRLRAIDRAATLHIFEQIPPNRMSPICRDFTLYLMEENRNRLLNEEPE